MLLSNVDWLLLPHAHMLIICGHAALPSCVCVFETTRLGSDLLFQGQGHRAGGGTCCTSSVLCSSHVQQQDLSNALAVL